MVSKAIWVAVSASISMPGLTDSLDGRLATNPIVLKVGRQINFYMGDGNRMAQRYQVGGFFAGHDAGNPGDAEDIAFFVSHAHNHPQRLRLHFDKALGDGGALAGLFTANIDNMGVTCLIKVWGMSHLSVE